MKIAKCKIQVSFPIDGGGKGRGEMRDSVGHESCSWWRGTANRCVVIFLCFFIAGCTKPISEEDKLKNIVNEVAESAQKKDIDGIRKHICICKKHGCGNKRRNGHCEGQCDTCQGQGSKKHKRYNP